MAIDVDTVSRALGVVLVAVVVAAVGVGLAAGPAAADEHTYETAEEFPEKANFTIVLPERTDHYPGDHEVHAEQNGYNASVEYYSVGSEAMKELGAEDGSYLDMIIIEADWIDYSQCDATSNTKAFGIDRGNNNSGTKTDEGLIQYRKNSRLKPGGLTVTFYDFGDLSGDPPFMRPNDAIVAAQGVGSNDGPCLKMTSEPGWYRMTGFINGTNADNGRGEPPSDDAREAGIIAKSNYVYICACDSEREARETLGPPPNEGGSSTDGADTPTPTRDGPTATPTPASTDTAVATAAPSTPTATAVATAARSTSTAGGGTASGDGRSTSQGGPDAAGQRSGVGRHTPTVAQAPGFTPFVTLLALLAAALVVARRT